MRLRNFFRWQKLCQGESSQGYDKQGFDNGDLFIDIR